MMILGFLFSLFSDGEIVQRRHYSVGILRYTEKIIVRRLTILIWTEMVAFLLAIWATPIAKKIPSISTIVGLVLLLTIVIQLLALAFHNKKIKFLTMVLGKLVSLAAWGGYSAFALSHFAISWTTFYVMLVTMALALFQISIFSPRQRYLVISLLVLLLPGLIAHTLVFTGIHAAAIFGFIITYSLALVIIGKKLNSEFWVQASDQNRLRTIINVIPGALAWYDNDGNFVDANKTFQQQVMTYKNSLQEVKDFVKKIYTSDQKKISHTILCGNKHYFFLGRKYSSDSEAMVIGLDLSREQFWQDRLEKQREIILRSSRDLAKGELIPIISEAPPEITKSIVNYMDNPEEETELQFLFLVVARFFEPYMQAHKIYFDVFPTTEDFRYEVKKDLFIAIACILQNAIDILKDKLSSNIKFSLELGPTGPKIDIEDNGPGVEQGFEEIIFEPLYSSKHNSGTGTGLSLAAEIVQKHGGNIKLSRLTQGSLFSIKLPRK